MPIDLKFLILDGENPKDWSLFGTKPFRDFMDELDKNKKTVRSASPGNDAHDLIFSPAYASRSSWPTLDRLDGVTGIVIDARSLGDAATVAALVNLLRYLSAKLQASDAALCKRLGYMALWFVTADEKIPAEVEKSAMDFSEIITNNVSGIFVQHNTLWQVEMLRRQIPTYLANVVNDARRRGMLK
jgi:hypothetical protein